MVDAFIRPIFQRSRLGSLPQFFLYVDTVNGAASHTIRPPVGVKWSLDYVQIFPVGTAAGYLQIALTDGTTTVVLAKTASVVTLNSVSWGSFGNGPLILTHDFYLITSTSYDGAGASISTSVAVEPVN